MVFPEIITRLSKYATPSKPLYLVGGAVRDSLLSRPGSDLDLVCAHDTRRIASNFANENNGDFFIMDEERETCRVLIATSSTDKLVVDFAAMRGENIIEDLGKRDFTINAMAVDLLTPEIVIDPFKGGRDLQQKTLRMVNDAGFVDDPLRTIRAVRYAVDLGLSMEPGMIDLINTSVSGLDHVSAERKRDELFKIFSGRKVHAALQLLDKFCIFRFIPLTITSEFTAAVTRSRTLEDLLGWLFGEKTHENQSAFYQSSLLVELGRYKEDLRKHFLVKNQSRRDRRSLLYLAVILEDKPGLESGLRNLTLSQDEVHQVCELKILSRTISALTSRGVVPEPIDIYRYFKVTASNGIDLAVTALADYTALVGSEFSQIHWLFLIKMAGALFNAWFRNPDHVAPVPLLNGDELMRRFSLEPGPLIGELLEQLKEEQVKGEINNQSQAIEWIGKRIVE